MTALKSGDFVVLTGNSAFAGKIARVLCRAPDADFALPCLTGVHISAAAWGSGCWSSRRKWQHCIAAATSPA